LRQLTAVKIEHLFRGGPFGNEPRPMAAQIKDEPDADKGAAAQKERLKKISQDVTV
jgi:hypothetical protein